MISTMMMRMLSTMMMMMMMLTTTATTIDVPDTIQNSTNTNTTKYKKVLKLG